MLARLTDMKLSVCLEKIWIITTMALATTPNKNKNLNLNKKAIALSAICAASASVAVVTSSLTFTTPSVFAQYGLGLPKSAGTGGATRGNLPQITMLVPEDGAKTLAARPTFYWYIAAANLAPSTTVPKVDDGKNSFKVTFFLRDGNAVTAKSVFVAEGKAEEPGLYKFTLPEAAPELVKGKVQRWQIRWQTNAGVSQVDVNSPILRDDNPAVLKAIALSKSDLEKARIYVKNVYWYDAIDAYTNWLSANPQDEVARTERSNLLKEGFKTHTAFSKKQQGNITKLLNKLDASKSAIAIALQTKTRR